MVVKVLGTEKQLISAVINYRKSLEIFKTIARILEMIYHFSPFFFFALYVICSNSSLRISDFQSELLYQ